MVITVNSKEGRAHLYKRNANSISKDTNSGLPNS